MRHRFEFLLFQLLKRAVLMLPLRSAQRTGAFLGSIAYHLMGKRREIALDNLRHAFPEKSGRELSRIARGAFRNYGTTFVEFLWFPNLTPDGIRRLVRIRNPEMIEKASMERKGLVMLSGHFGNWELNAYAVGAITGIPFTIIVQTQNNPYVDEVINRHRCLGGNRVVPMGMAVREIIRTLERGDAVAIAPDQSAAKESVYVDFFGRSVSTHQGSAVFSLRMGAPLEMGFIMRQADGTYEIVFEDIPRGDILGYTDEHVLELTRRHTAMLERYIRLHPDHWLWMHRRWKHLGPPPGGGSPGETAGRA